MTARWSPQTVSDLKALADEGHSASIASIHFSGMNRNMALGLAWRNDFHFLGLSTKSQKEPKMQATQPYVEVVTEENSPGITIEELQSDSCRWIGIVRGRYCGDRAVEGRPYCAHHCRMAYQPRVK